MTDFDNQEFLIDQVNQILYGSIEPTKYCELIYQELSTDFDLTVFKKFNPFDKYITTPSSTPSPTYACFIGTNKKDKLIFAFFNESKIYPMEYSLDDTLPITKCTPEQEAEWNLTFEKLTYH